MSRFICWHSYPSRLHCLISSSVRGRKTLPSSLSSKYEYSQKRPSLVTRARQVMRNGSMSTRTSLVSRSSGEVSASLRVYCLTKVTVFCQTYCPSLSVSTKRDRETQNMPPSSGAQRSSPLGKNRPSTLSSDSSGFSK